MAQPLTKVEPDGTLYRRPAAVEAQIDAAVRMLLPDLRRHLLVTDRNDAAYLCSECLVHILRRGRQAGDQALMSAVLPVLLSRCEANLLVKVPDGCMPDAAGLRQGILDEITDLFVLDGSGPNPDELDFYECRFNMAFRSLRIDAVRRASRRRKEIVDVDVFSPSEADGEPDSYEDACARISDAFKVFPTQEWDVFREPFLKAIEALPADERDAVILVHVLGYKEESEDPGEETAATRCNCTGRTIRNRLMRAARKLARFKEYL